MGTMVESRVQETFERVTRANQKELSRLLRQVYRNFDRFESPRNRRSHNERLIEDELYYALGYNFFKSVDYIRKAFNCATLQPRARWGYNVLEQNESYTVTNHLDMCNDQVRVRAFTSALQRVAGGRRMLDVGAGPFCLLSRISIRSGAKSVDSVESNERMVRYAMQSFEDEQFGREEPNIPFLLPPRPGGMSVQHTVGLRNADELPCLAGHRHNYCDCNKDEYLRGTVGLFHGDMKDNRHNRTEPAQRLRLYHGLSSKVPLEGQYEVVVHEILGHVASAEGVVSAMQDLKDRKLLTKDCVFVPKAVSTMFSPCTAVEFTRLERVVQQYYHGTDEIKTRTKYHARNFPPSAILAPPQALEHLEFSVNIELNQNQTHDCEFRTNKEGAFYGLHFHMVVAVDEAAIIDTFNSNTTWRTTFVPLFERGIPLKAGSRILCACRAELASNCPKYTIKVYVGERGQEDLLSTYDWEGCS